MSDQTVAAIVGVAVYIALRIVDYLLPTGRRFRALDRWTRDTREDDDDADPLD